MYFVRMNVSSKRLAEFHMMPTQIKNFRVNQALPKDSQWLEKTLNRESKQFNVQVKLREDNKLDLKWR